MLDVGLPNVAGPGGGPLISTEPDKMTSAIAFEQRGRSGLRHWGGYIDDEPLRELRGWRGVRTFREMEDNDDMCGAIAFAMKTLGKTVKVTCEPGGQSSDAKTRAEFVESCFMQDMSQTWTDFLGDALSFLTYGWAYHEQVFKLRKGDSTDPSMASRFTDGKVGVRKLALRPQDTLDRWAFTQNGSIRGMIQRDPETSNVYGIPIEKALLFRTSTYKNNPEGRSIFRSAYRSWYFKKNIQQIEGIGIERDLAGYPVVQLISNETVKAPDLWNDKDPKAAATLAYLQGMVRLIRRDEQEGAILPPWAELSLLSSGSRRQFDTNAVITRYDQRIAMTTLADFLLLGHDAVGSKALSVSKIELFTLALWGFVDSIVQVINRFCIPNLMKLNGWSTTDSPKLIVGKIENVDLAILGDYFAKLSAAGMPLFPDPDLERHALEAAKLPVNPDRLTREIDPDALFGGVPGAPEPGTEDEVVIDDESRTIDPDDEDEADDEKAVKKAAGKQSRDRIGRFAASNGLSSQETTMLTMRGAGASDKAILGALGVDLNGGHTIANSIRSKLGMKPGASLKDAARAAAKKPTTE